MYIVLKNAWEIEYWMLIDMLYCPMAHTRREAQDTARHVFLM